MARKNVLPAFLMFDAADLSDNATSHVVNVQNMDKASIHLSWAGSSPVGTVAVQARNGSTDGWYNLDMGGTISISGAGDHQLIFNELPFTDIRLIYSRSSGSGSMDASITLKQVGG